MNVFPTMSANLDMVMILRIHLNAVTVGAWGLNPGVERNVGMSSVKENGSVANIKRDYNHVQGGEM